jgi:hypothetical protein
MDTTNPRWQPSELRRAHSATIWKLIVCAAAGAAVSTIIATTVLDHGRAAAPHASAPTAPAALDVTTSAAPSLAPLPRGQGEPAIAPSPSRSFVEARPLVDELPAPTAPVTLTSAQVATTEAPAADAVASDTPAPRAAMTSEPAEAGSPVAPRAKAPVVDPNRGSNPEAPPMSAGAGRFLTEAPPWAGSAMTSNPDAGAGRFSTEPPPWAGSAWTSDPNAGAGPFQTERNRR